MKNNHVLLNTTVIIILSFAVYFLKIPASLDFSVFIYQARDLFRMGQILEGVPIFYGPEIFGGGHLPGPFYYLMYLIPYAHGGIETVASWHYIYYSIAVALLTCFAYKRWGKLSAVIIFILFSFSVFHRDQLSSNFNPSASPIFQVLILILILKLRNKWNQKYWIALCTTINLSLQIHFSFILFYIYVLFLFKKQNKLKLFYGFLLSGTVLLPYLIGTSYCSFNTSNFCPMETVGNASDGVSFLALPFKALTSLDLKGVFSNIFEFIHRVYFDDYILLCGTILLLLYFIKNKSIKRLNGDQLIIFHLFIISHFGHIWNLFSGMVFLRYLQHYYFFLIVLIAVIISSQFEKQINKSKRYLLGATLIYSLLVALLIQVDNKIYNQNNSKQVEKSNSTSNMYYRSLKKLLGYIHQETNWDYETFSRRSYWIGLNQEEDKSIIYNELRNNLTDPIKEAKGEYGFIIAKVRNKAHFEQEVSKLLKTPFEKKQVFFKDLKMFNDIAVIKYIVDSNADIPKLFGNLGFHYILPPHVQKLNKYYSENTGSGVKMLGPGHWRGCWDCELPNWKNVEIKIKKLDNNQYNLNLSIDGISLSSVDAVTPLATERLKNISLKIECSDKTLTKFTGSIGGFINDNDMYKYFGAPYQNYFKIVCKKIHKVTIGFEKLVRIKLLEHWTQNKYHVSHRPPIIFMITPK